MRCWITPPVSICILLQSHRLVMLVDGRRAIVLSVGLHIRGV
jgi:hypothetical protein